MRWARVRRYDFTPSDDTWELLIGFRIRGRGVLVIALVGIDGWPIRLGAPDYLVVQGNLSPRVARRRNRLGYAFGCRQPADWWKWLRVREEYQCKSI